jgi:hypothetical protein
VSYVNLPESLQKIFTDLDERVLKVENSQRFTIPVVPVVITAASGDGTTITYTANNVFAPGQAITITGLSVASGSSLNFAIAIVASASYTQFTVTSPVIGVSSGSGQAIIYAPTVNGLNPNDPAYPRPGDMWINSQSNVLKFLDGFGSSRSVLAPYLAINTTTQTTASTSLDLFGQQYLEANKVYEIEALIGFGSTYSTNTVRTINATPAFTGSVNYYQSQANASTTAHLSAPFSSYNFSLAALSIDYATFAYTSSTGVAKIWGIISTSSNGYYTMSLSTDTSTNLTQLSKNAGTYLRLTPLASSRVTNSGSLTPAAQPVTAAGGNAGGVYYSPQSI